MLCLSNNRYGRVKSMEIMIGTGIAFLVIITYEVTKVKRK